MTGAGSPTVARVLKGQLCTGCGLCAGVAPESIRMGVAPPGYSRPEVHGPVKERAERLIANACPGARVAPWPTDANLHAYWGPWRGVFTGHAKDDAVRYRGSSGGALTALAIHALRSGAVDRVVHVLPDPAHPARNILACSTNEADIVEGAGSRYSSSSPLASIDKMLFDGGALAFIGKPCDISALRRLGSLDQRVGRHVRLMLSFFCAGISSHRAADKVIAAMGLAPGDVTAFRYRGNGWPGAAAATTRDGAVARMSYAESWGGYLCNEVQFRCKICPDAVGGVADIACADAWYGDENGYPLFEELDGRSLILSRTAAGVAHLESAVAAGALEIQPLDIAEIDKMQPGQTHRKRVVSARVAALFATLQTAPDMRGTLVGHAAQRARPREKLRNFLGTVRRIVMNKR